MQCHESWPSCHLTSHQQIKCNDGPNCHIVTISQTICIVSEGQEKPAHVQDNGNNENTGDRSHTHTATVSRVVFRSTLIDHWKSVNLNVTFQDEASKFWFWLFV